MKVVASGGRQDVDWIGESVTKNEADVEASLERVFATVVDGAEWEWDGDC